MAKKDLVNLDALIHRQDLDIRVPGATNQTDGANIPISDLEKGKIWFRLLRKPDFQRETDDWSIDNVVTLIKSFRDGHLIPSLIMWGADSGYTFVIDGAHRLSALIAWVNDDYGDRAISLPFFNYRISRQQERAARLCRERVAAEVGTYTDLSGALNHDNPPPERVRWASNITRPLATQWVKGDAKNAERSFIVINQRSVQIDDTERYMIEARSKPNVIATRALIRCATGHKYWAFDEATSKEIEDRAKAIFDILFEPENAEAMRDTELPVAGKAYTANGVRITLDLIDYANNTAGQSERSALKADTDGRSTLAFLDNVYGIVKYMSGNHPASLGLHPAVYFWGATGNHQPSAFLAMTRFMKKLIERNQVIVFSMHRALFEEFLVDHSPIFKFVLGKIGGWSKSVAPLLAGYECVYDGLRNGDSPEKIKDSLLKIKQYQNYRDEPLEETANTDARQGPKAALRRQSILANAARCAICHARLPMSEASYDHIEKASKGGKGTQRNLQLTHHFCNHGLREHLEAKGIPLPSNPFV